MNAQKPFDFLQNKIGSEIVVSLKNDEAYKGKLVAYDIHLNLVLEESTLITEKSEVELGTVLIRGDNILTVRNL